MPNQNFVVARLVESRHYVNVHFATWPIFRSSQSVLPPTLLDACKWLNQCVVPRPHRVKMKKNLSPIVRIRSNTSHKCMALWELLCPTPTELGTYYIRTLLKTYNVSVGCKLKKLSRIGTRYGLHIWQFTSSTCGLNHVLIHSIMWLENSPYVYVSGLMS